jgi:phthalate 4,5-dioxygenase oxygenase subunit
VARTTCYPVRAFRLKANPSNDHLIDRHEQKTKTFTGIKGINTQDFALQENMGIVDRSLEHLGTTDRAIIAMRQQLLDAVADVAAGETPKGADPASSREVRPADGDKPRDRDWREFFGPKMVALW